MLSKEYLSYSGHSSACADSLSGKVPGRIKMEGLHSMRSWMPLRLFSLVALLCLSTAVYAQRESPARYQIYGGYAFLSNSINGVPGSHHPLNGWDVSLGFPAWHSLRFKIDVASFRGSNLGAPQNPLSIMGGAQYARRVKRESVFVEGLAGDIAMNEYWGAAEARRDRFVRFPARRRPGHTNHAPDRIPGERRLSVLLFRPRQLDADRRSPIPDPRFAHQLRAHLLGIGLEILVLEPLTKFHRECRTCQGTTLQVAEKLRWGRALYQGTIDSLKGAVYLAGWRSCRRHSWPLSGTLTAALFPMAKLSGAVKPVSLENIRKLPRVAFAATHGVLQEDQWEDVQQTQLGYAKVR